MAEAAQFSFAGDWKLDGSITTPTQAFESAAKTALGKGISGMMSGSAQGCRLQRTSHDGHPAARTVPRRERHAQTGPADSVESSIEASIHVASVDTNVAQRDDHLRSADFFDAANHPTMTFVSRDVGVETGRTTSRGRGSHHAERRDRSSSMPIHCSPESRDPFGMSRRFVTKLSPAIRAESPRAASSSSPRKHLAKFPK